MTERLWLASSSGDRRVHAGDVVTTDDAEAKPGQLVAVAIEGRVVVGPLLGHATGRFECLRSSENDAFNLFPAQNLASVEHGADEVGE